MEKDSTFLRVHLEVPPGNQREFLKELTRVCKLYRVKLKSIDNLSKDSLLTEKDKEFLKSLNVRWSNGVESIYERS